MKSLCAAGHNKDLNCCGSNESTSCCDFPFVGNDILKCPEPKSIFSGPNITVDIEFKEVSCSVKIKGNGKIVSLIS